jgi:hypothetical protein
MYKYVQMLYYKLPDMQYIIFGSNDIMSKRLIGVEDEWGVVLVDLGKGEDVPGVGLMLMPGVEWELYRRPIKWWQISWARLLNKSR